MLVSTDLNFSKETLLKYINKIIENLTQLDQNQQEIETLLEQEMQNHNENWQDKSEVALKQVKIAKDLAQENLKNALERNK